MQRGPEIPRPRPAPPFPGEFRGGDLVLKRRGPPTKTPSPRGIVMSGIPGELLTSRELLASPKNTTPKPGHFSIGRLLYFLFPTSAGFNFVFVSVQFSYGNSETFPTIFFYALLVFVE